MFNAENLNASKLTVDYSEFNRALSDYMVETGKSLSDALNRCAKNISIQAVKNAPVAHRGQIKGLTTEPKLLWWFAWQIKWSIDGAMESHNEKYGLRTGILRSGITRTEAYKKSIMIINHRANATGFVKAFFSAMSKAVDGKEAGKRFSGIVPTFSKANDENQKAEIGVKFDFKKEKDSNKVENILWEHLQVGINEATKDMRQYMLKKLQESGDKISPK